MTVPSAALAVPAALVAATAVVLWLPPTGWLLALRLGPDRLDRPAVLDAVRRRVRSGLTGWAPVLVAGCAAPWFVSSPVSAVLVATVVGVAVFGLRLLERSRAGREAEALGVRVAATVELLAAELRTGVLPAVALRGACEDLPELGPAAEVAARAGDVPAALDVVARRPGGADLAHLAAAWRVAERAGAPVAGVLDHVVEAVRADQQLAREVRSECASARATARLLAVLPLLGLGLGSGMGGDPVHVLTGTLPGVVCLAAGCTLAACGLTWVERITARAEHGPR